MCLPMPTRCGTGGYWIWFSLKDVRLRRLRKQSDVLLQLSAILCAQLSVMCVKGRDTGGKSPICKGLKGIDTNRILLCTPKDEINWSLQDHGGRPVLPPT